METTSDTQHDRPRIYISAINLYSGEALSGTWINAAQDAMTIHFDIQKYLDGLPPPTPEEWAVHDYEHFGQLHIPEHPNLYDIAGTAERIGKHGLMFTALLTKLSGLNSFKEACYQMDEAYAGRFTSVEAYVRHSMAVAIDDLGMHCPGFLYSKINYKEIATHLSNQPRFLTVEWDELRLC